MRKNIIWGKLIDKRLLLLLILFLILFFSMILFSKNVVFACPAGSHPCDKGSCSMNTSDNDWRTGCDNSGGEICCTDAPGGGGGGGGGGGRGSDCPGSCDCVIKDCAGVNCAGRPKETCSSGYHGLDCQWREKCPPPCDPNSWGAWSSCSASCAGGTQTRTNACGTSQSQSCNTQACPIVPTATPIPPTITSVPVSCVRKAQGDANCDGKVDGIDYSLWLNSQCHPAAGQTCADTRADFNRDGKTDDDDYTIWFTNR